MHDVISDILASPKVPKDKKRQEILVAAARYRDSTSFAMTRKEWTEMAGMMGVANMGGPAVGFLSAFPAPTVARGASADEAMKSMSHSGSAPAADHSRMPGMATPTDTARKATEMEGMHHAPAPATTSTPRAAPRASAPAARAARNAPRPSTNRAAKVAKPAKPAKPSAQPAKARAPQAPKAKPTTPAEKKSEPPMDHSNMPGMKKMP
ncbi:MAG: hypothetical protein ABIP93_19470 [Gemmatimonadaceae bacterium]